MKSYVYKIENFGSRFRNIGDDNLRGYALSIQQDHVDPNLIFLGTELGLYVSTSGGDDWFKFTQGVPTVSVMDMAIQERENDLILGTHGRSVIVIDDYSPLRGLNDDSFKEPLALLSTSDGQQYTADRAPSTRFWGSGAFAGENEAFGVVLNVMASGDFLEHPDVDKDKARSIKLRQAKAAKGEDDESKDDKKPSAKARVEVSDANGKVVRTFVTTLKQGVNRVVWPMNLDGTRPLPGNEPKEDKDILPAGFVQALPGTYTFKITLNDNEVIGTAKVLQDPRYNLRAGELEERQSMMNELMAMQNTVSDMVHALTDTKANVELVQEKAKAMLADVENKDDHPLTQLNKQGDELLKQIKEQDKQIRTPSDAVGIVDSSFTLNSKIGRVAFFLGSHYGAPSDTAKAFMKIARRHLDERIEAVNDLVSGDLSEFNQAFEQSNLNLLKTVEVVKAP